MSGINLIVQVLFRGLFQTVASIKTTKFVLFIKTLLWHLLPEDVDSFVLGCVPGICQQPQVIAMPENIPAVGCYVPAATWVGCWAPGPGHSTAGSLEA